jgi:hypothetical protein
VKLDLNERNKEIFDVRIICHFPIEELVLVFEKTKIDIFFSREMIHVEDGDEQQHFDEELVRTWRFLGGVRHRRHQRRLLRMFQTVDSILNDAGLYNLLISWINGNWRRNRFVIEKCPSFLSFCFFCIQQLSSRNNSL